MDLIGRKTNKLIGLVGLKQGIQPTLHPNRHEPGADAKQTVWSNSRILSPPRVSDKSSLLLACKLKVSSHLHISQLPSIYLPSLLGPSSLHLIAHGISELHSFSAC